jgi:hypothetical protein
VKIVAEKMEPHTEQDGYPWLVRFKRVEVTNGNWFSSVPVFRDRAARAIVDDWLRDNGCGPICFLNSHSVMFKHETDALLCYAFFA